MEMITELDDCPTVCEIIEDIAEETGGSLEDAYDVYMENLYQQITSDHDLVQRLLNDKTVLEAIARIF